MEFHTDILFLKILLRKASMKNNISYLLVVCPSVRIYNNNNMICYFSCESCPNLKNSNENS